jgi:hypothetical protein
LHFLIEKAFPRLGKFSSDGGRDGGLIISVNDVADTPNRDEQEGFLFLPSGRERLPWL